MSVGRLALRRCAALAQRRPPTSTAARCWTQLPPVAMAMSKGAPMHRLAPAAGFPARLLGSAARGRRAAAGMRITARATASKPSDAPTPSPAEQGDFSLPGGEVDYLPWVS